MADHYRIYGSANAPELDNLARTSFPGYFASDSSSFPSHRLRSPDNLQRPTDYMQKDILPLRPGAYGLDDVPGISIRSTAGIGGLIPGTTARSLAVPLDEPIHVSQRRDVPPEINMGGPDIVNARASSLRKVGGLLGEESNILFVDGLPTDCMRREVSHLFRPFIGFKDIIVIHREARRTRDKARVYCFVEFSDPKCALTAMEALQGYKFDDKKPDAPVLRIQFAKFPFRPPSSQDDQPRGDLR